MVAPALRSLVALLLAGFITWLSVCIDQIATPRADPIQQVDAVYVIGPVETRIDEVLQTMDAGIAPVLLATTSINPDTGKAYATDHCGEVRDGYRIECVLPRPYTTRGEARLLRSQVHEHGWSKVAVMTSTPHLSRTRLLMERCVDADVLLWPVETKDIGSVGWTIAFVYQSAAWVKTQLERDC